MTIEERLSAMGMEQKAEQKGVSAPPKADTLALLLAQGLQSQDKKILNVSSVDLIVFAVLSPITAKNTCIYLHKREIGISNMPIVLIQGSNLRSSQPRSP